MRRNNYNTERSHQQLNQSSKKLTSKTERVKTSQIANVNSYKHFLAVPSTGHNYIEWAFGLRSAYNPKSLRGSSGTPPQTYYKTTECQKQKHTSADISTKVNISQFSHLAMHRIKENPSSGQLLNFETSLRWNDNKSKQYEKLKEREKGWSTIPKRDRHEDPVFIRSKSLKKKIISPQQYESGVDGPQKYPHYTEKIIKSKNTNQYRHMMKGKINLPSISWQTNLRSY